MVRMRTGTRPLFRSLFSQGKNFWTPYRISRISLPGKWSKIKLFSKIVIIANSSPIFYHESGRIGVSPRENCSIGLWGKCYNLYSCFWMAKSLERGEVLWCWGRLHRNARRPILKQIFTFRFIDGYQERDIKLLRMIFEKKDKKNLVSPWK